MKLVKLVFEGFFPLALSPESSFLSPDPTQFGVFTCAFEVRCSPVITKFPMRPLSVKIISLENRFYLESKNIRQDILNILFLYQKIINFCKTHKKKSKENKGQQYFVD